MPPRKHNLLTRYDWLADNVKPPVLESIVVSPRSRGILRFPGSIQHQPASSKPRSQGRRRWARNLQRADHARQP
jgi:hypothetical protein